MWPFFSTIWRHTFSPYAFHARYAVERSTAKRAIASPIALSTLVPAATLRATSRASALSRPLSERFPRKRFLKTKRAPLENRDQRAGPALGECIHPTARRSKEAAQERPSLPVPGRFPV